MSDKAELIHPSEHANIHTSCLAYTSTPPFLQINPSESPKPLIESTKPSKMPTILIVGATRGLGASLAKLYASDANNEVLATARSSNPPANSTYSFKGLLHSYREKGQLA